MPGVNTTDSQEEQLTEVDQDNNVISPILRGIAHHSSDKYYRTIFIIVKNQAGKILIQKRSASKDLYPNYWDLSVGGHVNFGVSYPETAIRELQEELGITTSPEKLKFLDQVFSDITFIKRILPCL
ncbi:MAG: NUDIX domain-containing protein [bacterium]